MTGFYCNSCGAYHNNLPLSYSIPVPIYWSENLRKDHNSKLGQDVCIIKNEQFFLRGNIEIPIIDSNNLFAYSIWVSLSKKSFDHISENWNKPTRVHSEPYFGWLSSQIPNYPNTLNLKTMVHTRELNVVPFIELEPTDHPLSIEQYEGITMQRVKEIAELSLHGEEKDSAHKQNISFWRRLIRRS